MPKSERENLAEQYAAHKDDVYTPGFCPLCSQPFPESASQPGADMSAQPGATPDPQDIRWASHFNETREHEMQNVIERRYCQELRAGEGTDEMVLLGYAARFNSLSKDCGGFREMIAPGAFTRAIADKQDVCCFFNHGMKNDAVLGRTTSGTLVLSQDDKGLFFRCQLDSNQQSHRDLHASVKRGDINECSFAFAPNGEAGDEWRNAQDESGKWYINRTLKDLNLFDVSAVTRPAYNTTSLQARSEADAFDKKYRSVMSKLIQTRTQAGTEKREESVEQALGEVSKALAKQFPCEPTGGECCSSYGKYYITDTYDDYVIACNNMGPGPSEYVRISYVQNPDGDGYIFGEPLPVEKEWVPSDRAAKKFEELRTVKAEHMQALANAHKDQAAQHDSAAADATATAAAHKDASDAHTSAAEKLQKEADAKKACDDSDGDCGEKRCMCQNRMTKAENVDGDYGDDENEFENGDDDDKRAAKTAARIEVRKAANKPDSNADGMVRTKLVAGKELAMRSFAHAPDADKTESWKLPVHSGEAAQRSFGRVDASKIPADKVEEARNKVANAVAQFAPAPAIAGEDRMSAEEIEDMQLRFRLSLFSNEVTEVRYSDDQPRDKDGKFGSGGDPASKGAAAAKADAALHNSFSAGTKGKEDAVNKYTSAHQEAMGHIATISKALEAAKGEGNKNWGHVGSVQHYAAQLKDVADSLTGQGEYKK